MPVANVLASVFLSY